MRDKECEEKQFAADGSATRSSQVLKKGEMSQRRHPPSNKPSGQEKLSRGPIGVKRENVSRM